MHRLLVSFLFLFAGCTATDPSLDGDLLEEAEMAELEAPTDDEGGERSAATGARGASLRKAPLYDVSRTIGYLCHPGDIDSIYCRSAADRYCPGGQIVEANLSQGYSSEVIVACPTNVVRQTTVIGELHGRTGGSCSAQAHETRSSLECMSGNSRSCAARGLDTGPAAVELGAGSGLTREVILVCTPDARGFDIAFSYVTSFVENRCNGQNLPELVCRAAASRACRSMDAAFSTGFISEAAAGKVILHCL